MYKTYLVGWCLMECGPIASGLSFNGYDEVGNARHDKVQSANIYKLETSYKVKDFLANWNISAHEWLKHYVYVRQLDNKQRGHVNGNAAMITFVVSAVWHGFYPGYYVFFIGAGLMDVHFKFTERALGPYFSWLPFPVIYGVAYLWCYMGCAYFAIGFVLQSVSKFH
jgi:lysophospholipid acyltransferase